MSTNKQVATSAPTEKKVLGAIDTVGAGRKEKNFQIKLERMQLVCATGDVQMAKAIVAAQKELEALKKLTAEFLKLKEIPVSNYAPLQSLFDSTLKHITVESLAKEYSIQAAKLKERALTKLNPAQEAVIDRFYAIKAKKEWTVISQIKAVLDIRFTKSPVAAPIAAEPVSA